MRNQTWDRKGRRVRGRERCKMVMVWDIVKFVGPLKIRPG